MTDASPTAALLDPEHAAFIQSGVSVVVASRNAANVASVVRAAACRVSADRQRVTVLLPMQPAARVLADLAATRSIAVVFSQPSTHRTIQLKGGDAERVATTAEDLSACVAQEKNWVADLMKLGYAEGFARALHHVPLDELVAVRFTASSAFSQTPGPHAGAKLGGSR